ncbi:hypothetical protein [Aquimarina sp. 2304DJ70-9]|uniref:hypothetical protein n=1 Tax=Aquimarina penaris TaxID=3231044 RepID=UPI0034623B80
MKIKPLVYLFLLLFISSIQAQRQYVLETIEDSFGYNQIPQEKMFIHYNTTLLFAGEYLYYRLYCLNIENNHLSDISKIGYVELIGENGKAVFKHKIKLENGSGQGDFFLPVSVPSGNYKLIGYTQWMLNAESNLFFQGDITILNPYQGDQKAILSNNSLESSINGNINPIKSQIIKSKVSAGITLALNKEVVKKRSPVVLTIDKHESINQSGDYSISVSKKNSYVSAKAISTVDFSILNSKNIKNKMKSVNSSIFLPEMRGELMYGKVIPKEPTFPVSSVQIAMSIPGKTNDIKIVSTNDKGNFMINLNKTYSEDEFVFQVLGENRNDYRIELSEIPEVDYPNFDFYKFKLTQELKDHIIDRSVHNQIDNSFFTVKPDTIQDSGNYLPFYGNHYTTYSLDEYTRFATVRETIVEIVDDVWMTKDAGGDKVFAVRGYYPTQEDYGYKPLVIIDGIVEQEHEDFMEYDARKIKKISLVRDRYFLGTKIFEGVLIFETIEGNYSENLNKAYLLKTELLRPLAHKNYYKQQYGQEINDYDRIPDFRSQLLWEPSVTLSDTKTIKFFTSDVAGDYEISLEGFTNDGVPVSLKKQFKVE